jgi:hypothetical protein
MNHLLQCRCGAIKGWVDTRYVANRGVCYCLDCQAFAHFLGREKDMLDERGGSDVIQTLPKSVTFTQGAEALACMRLTPKGLLRWYSSCCGTPMGNMLATPKVSFVGLVHVSLRHSGKSLDEVFGPVRAWVNTSGAKGEPKPRSAGMGGAAFRLIGMMLKARINGDYRRTPFFRIADGSPVATPRILTSEEHANLMHAVHAA